MVGLSYHQSQSVSDFASILNAEMKTLMVLILGLVSGCTATPWEGRQMFGGGMDPSFGPGFGDPASPFNANPMARTGMDPSIFGSSLTQGQGGRATPFAYGFSGPHGYGQDVGGRGFSEEGRSGYAYEPRQRYGGESAYSYEPRQRYGGESMYEPTGRFGGSYMGGSGDQFIGSDPNIASGMGGMGAGLGGMAGFGGGMGGDGMDDMVRMQAEMQQMQQQMKQRQQASANPNKGNTSTNVEKVGDNLLVTNQTRFVDTNDGLTQGFFQEFHIYPGMETTTAASRDSTPAQSVQTTGRPTVDVGKHDAVINPATIFGFAPPDNFFNPRKIAPTSSTVLKSDRDSNLVPKVNEVKGRSPTKKAFSTEKFETLGENFNRAFDSL